MGWWRGLARCLGPALGGEKGRTTLEKLWGRSLAADGRFAAAAERFHRALTLAPDDAEASQLVEAIERRIGVAAPAPVR